MTFCAGQPSQPDTLDLYMLLQCWAGVAEGGPTSKQHRASHCVYWKRPMMIITVYLNRGNMSAKI